MPFDSEGAKRLAAIRRPCPWCGVDVRPCNLPAHLNVHFHQLDLDEVIELIDREQKERAANNDRP